MHLQVLLCQVPGLGMSKQGSASAGTLGKVQLTRLLQVQPPIAIECALQEIHDELLRLGLPLDDPSWLLQHVYEGLGPGWKMYTVPTGVGRSSTRPTKVGSSCYM
jgi:hypothetical protein